MIKIIQIVKKNIVLETITYVFLMFHFSLVLQCQFDFR